MDLQIHPHAKIFQEVNPTDESFKELSPAYAKKSCIQVGVNITCKSYHHLRYQTVVQQEFCFIKIFREQMAYAMLKRIKDHTMFQKLILIISELLIYNQMYPESL